MYVYVIDDYSLWYLLTGGGGLLRVYIKSPHLDLHPDHADIKLIIFMFNIQVHKSAFSWRIWRRGGGQTPTAVN